MIGEVEVRISSAGRLGRLDCRHPVHSKMSKHRTVIRLSCDKIAPCPNEDAVGFDLSSFSGIGESKKMRSLQRLSHGIGRFSIDRHVGTGARGHAVSLEHRVGVGLGRWGRGCCRAASNLSRKLASATAWRVLPCASSAARPDSIASSFSVPCSVKGATGIFPQSPAPLAIFAVTYLDRVRKRLDQRTNHALRGPFVNMKRSGNFGKCHAPVPGRRQIRETEQLNGIGIGNAGLLASRIHVHALTESDSDCPEQAVARHSDRMIKMRRNRFGLVSSIEF